MGAVGAALPQPFVVQLLATDGLPLAGAPVDFSGGATFAPASVVTDASGRASTTVSLDTTTGAKQIVAHSGAVSVATTFTATPAAPSAVVAVSGDAQSGPVGSTLDPFVVRVVDRYGNAIAGATVAWQRTAGSGTLEFSSSVTGADGVATNFYRLGATAGSESVVASVTGAGQVPFSATAVAQPSTPTASPSRMLLVTSAADATGDGSPFGQQPAVQVVDSLGVPVAGVLVTVVAPRPVDISLRCSGLTGNPIAITDATGTARFQDVGINCSGVSTFLLYDAGGVEIYQTLPIGAGPAKTLRWVSDSIFTVAAGVPAITPTLEALDAAGVGVPGIAVRVLLRNYSEGIELDVMDTTLVTDASGRVVLAGPWPLSHPGSLGSSSDLWVAIPGVVTGGTVFITP